MTREFSPIVLFHLAASIFMMMLPSVTYAQIESADSVSSGIHNSGITLSATGISADSISTAVNPLPDFGSESMVPAAMLPSMSLTQSRALSLSYMLMPGQSAPLLWNGGGLFGRGYGVEYPGLMRYDNATLGVLQNFDNFTIYAGGIVNRYGSYWGGAHTQFGLEGSIAYQFAPNMTVNAFGIYYFGKPPHMANGMPMSPAMTGFYARSSFGATIDYQINDHWGVEAGAQMVQQIGTNRYEAEPIATPYYKINNKVKIGLPVGQILYHLLRK